MLTAQQFRDTLIAERLILEPVGGGWVAKTADGGRLVRTPAATPEAAVEQAKAVLDAASARNEAAIAVRTVEELQRGEIFARPREEAVPGEPGATRRVFDLYGADGTPLDVSGEVSLVAAVEAHVVRRQAVREPASGGPRR